MTKIIRNYQNFSGTAIIIIGFAGVLYPLWPQQLRGGVYYLSWGGLGFVGFVIVLAIRKFFIIGHIRTLIRFVLTRYPRIDNKCIFSSYNFILFDLAFHWRKTSFMDFPEFDRRLWPY